MSVSGLSLETWEIKYNFWVRNRDLIPVFDLKLQTWLLSSLPACWGPDRAEQYETYSRWSMPVFSSVG